MEKAEIKKLVAKLGDLKTELYQSDFLLTRDQSLAGLQAVLVTAEILEEMWRAKLGTHVFQGGLGISNFRDKSTRTRFSFASACSLLGLTYVDFDESKSQVEHGETVRETANMLSFLTEVIGIRDDMFLGEGHEYMEEVAHAVDDGVEQGVLPQRPTIINLQCDRDHPTQTIADLLHLQRTFGSLEALRGKKIAVSWAYSPSYAKPLSVPQGLISLLTRFGMKVVLAHPEGYELQHDVMEAAARNATESGGSFVTVNSMLAAFPGADIVYPKSWAPVSIMRRRATLVRSGETKKLADLEKEALHHNETFRGWECSETQMKMTQGGTGLYMHCLPADISGVNCKAGEVAKTVFDRYRKETYKQAEHKLYCIAAMMLLTRFENPAILLDQMLSV